MGNAATTKKGDSTESGEYLTLRQTCCKWFKCERVNEEQVSACFSFVRQTLSLFLRER